MYKITYKGFVNSTRGLVGEYKDVEIPFDFFEEVWYCYKKRKRYVVRKSFISGIWATNIAGVTLDNGWQISESEFDMLFKNKDDAIDWCLKKNQRATVKIYGI